MNKKPYLEPTCSILTVSWTGLICASSYESANQSTSWGISDNEYSDFNFETE